MRLCKAGLAASVMAVIATASSASETLSQAPQLAAAVTAALTEFAIPGAAIGVWTPNGNWTMATGIADVATERSVKRADHFAIRSITKSFVVTVLMQLVAQSGSAINLDDPIAKYLPNIPNGNQITLRQLANMTSGLFNYTGSSAFLTAFVADPTRSWTTDELLAFAFDDPDHDPVNFAAGTRYQYSNTNTLVLGKLVEVLTGKPFDDVLRQQILLPLDLQSTSYLYGTMLPPPFVQGYAVSAEDPSPSEIVISFSALGFSGAMASTLHDLAGWGRALADGTLLPASLQQQRFATHPTAADPASPVYDAYGLGIGQVAGWWGHTGEGAGFEAAVFHQIDRNETFAVLLNATGTSDVPVKIFCRVLQILDEAPPAGSNSVCAPGNDGGSRSNATAAQ